MTIIPAGHVSRRRRSAKLIATVAVAAVLSSLGVTSAQAAEELSIGAPVLALGFENSVADASPTANATQLKGHQGAAAAATYVPGVVAGTSAISLGGATYLDLGTSQALLPTSLSLSFWLKPATTMTGEEMITWNKNAYNTDGFYVSSEGDSSPLAISIGPADGQPYKVRVQESDRNAFFPVGQWTNVVITFDQVTKAVTFYRNGLRVPSTIASPIGGTATGVIEPTASVAKTIGFNGPNYNGAYLKAALDEYRLYSGVATAADVATLYEAGGGTVDKAAIAAQDAAEINVPTSSLTNLVLPSEGNRGSRITWVSSNTAVIENDGTLHPPALGEADATVTLTATVRYAGGPASTRDFAVVVAAPKETLSDSGLSVLVNDDYMKNGMEKEHEYLLSLSSKKFLYWFYRTANLTPPTTSGYGGWEDGNSTLNFRGHAFGHYISALSMSYSATTDATTKAALLTQITDAVDGLKEVQDSYAGTSLDGYIAPFRESAFAQVEGRGTSDDPVIVPYYNIHKVLAGLLDVVRYAPQPVADEAKAIAQGFGEYVYRRMSTLANKSQMLGTEYGGMNDALYELFRITGNPHIKTAAEAFDEVGLFQSLANGQDVLNGKHANTMIPKIIGAVKRYTVFTQNPEYYNMLTETEKQNLGMYLTAAQNFWQIVTNDHTYVTGANSQSEHFHGPDTLYQYATQMGEVGNPQTAETCNVYNMLKLSRELFKLTQDVKYANFYETAFINDILSSQNPDTGMTTYFQAMAPGYNKLYSTPFTDFWCCTGSGMENFSKLGDSIYFTGSKSVWVNMFFSSEFSYSTGNLRVVQTADIPENDTVSFAVSSVDGGAIPADTELRLRIPGWIDGSPTLKINGTVTTPQVVNGYIVLSGLASGDQISYRMPMKLQAIATPDNADFVAFQYGPTVLSAGVGTTNIDKYTGVGIGVRVPKVDPDALSTLVVKSGTPAQWLSNLSANLVRKADVDGAVQFEVKGTDNADGVIFSPHYLRHDERYAMYVTVELPDSAASQQRILTDKLAQRQSELFIDTLTNFDNNNFEAEKNKKASANSTVGTFGDKQYRDAGAGGWFSWDLMVDPSASANYLSTTYYSGDVGRTFDVYINDVKLKTETVNTNAGQNVFYAQLDQIPQVHLTGPNVRYKVDTAGNPVLDANGNRIPVVTVRYQSTGGYAGGVFGVATTRPQVFDTNSTLSKLTFTVGQLDNAFQPSRTTYTLTVPVGTTAVEFDADPVKKSGLVKVGDVLIDDTKLRTVPLAAQGPTTLTINSFAQDHTTSTAYTIVIQQAAALNVSLSSATRCVAGKVTLVVTAKNESSVPATFAIATAYGTKTVTNLAAGKSSAQSFSTRLGAIEAGAATAHVTATVDGQPRSVDLTSSYAAATCR